MADEIGIEEFVPLLKEIGDSGCNYFLEGGQAVNFWAAYFTSRSDDPCHKLHRYLPFTSKDCDI